MTWVRLDDQFFINRKARSAGPDGQLLYLAGLCWCAMQLNDGHIHSGDLPAIAGLAAVTPDIADRLVAVGLWTRTDVGYDVPDYLAVNPSRQQVLAERSAAADRQRRAREASRRDSRRDIPGTNGVSNGPPVPSRPQDSPVSRRLGNSTADGQIGDDDELSTAVPDDVWTAYAELKLAQQTNVRNAGPWKTRTANNARTELADQAARWWQLFDITPRRLAEALVDGTAPRHVPYRQDAS